MYISLFLKLAHLTYFIPIEGLNRNKSILFDLVVNHWLQIVQHQKTQYL
ncbi:MAG: hypothetical protein ACKPKO_33540 [Candidatus Fonsibacter sp.]